MKPRYFATPTAWRAWLEAPHASSAELLVGFYKRGSGKPSITWPESVDEALCFGWIDGVRRTVDDERYTIRFTPRKARSTWSAVNVKRVGELVKLGRMRPAGLEAFARREPARSQIYSYEQPPWYRRTAIYWVMTAKKEETQKRRLATRIDDSAHGRTLKQPSRPAKSP